MAFLNREDLLKIGFKSVGDNVLLSDKASIYNAKNIEIGSNVRIDDFCILSAGDGDFKIGNYIHIGCYSCLIGGGNIILEDFSNISSKVSIYSSNDDYSGLSLTNPMVSHEFTNVTFDNVLIKKHVIIGSGSVILPGVTLNEGVAVGSLSLVNKDCEKFWIYGGTPAKKIKPRSEILLDIEKKFLDSLK